MEKFKIGDRVKWKKRQEKEEDRQLMRELAGQYGEGPFKVLDVRQVFDSPSHPQTVTLQIGVRKFPFSGKWLRRAKQ
ncbi:MAG: hypothetical protein WAV21_01255 [Minisyncoccia bacterium]